MTKEFSRLDRVAGQLQRELALLIHNELKDPRVGFVTISEVQLSKDMAHAKVYFTLLDASPEAREKAESALNHAAGFLRHMIGKNMSLRITPHLVFRFDEAPRRGEHLAAVIEKAIADDRADTKDARAGDDDDSTS